MHIIYVVSAEHKDRVKASQRRDRANAIRTAHAQIDALQGAATGPALRFQTDPMPICQEYPPVKFPIPMKTFAVHINSDSVYISDGNSHLYISALEKLWQWKCTKKVTDTAVEELLRTLRGPEFVDFDMEALPTSVRRLRHELMETLPMVVS